MGAAVWIAGHPQQCRPPPLHAGAGAGAPPDAGRHSPRPGCRRSGLLGQNGAHAVSESATLIDACLQGAQQLDPGEVAKALDSAQTALGLDATIDDVLLPAMRQIGKDWQAGRCDVAQEHLTTEAARAWLSKVAPDGKSIHERRQPIILVCGPDDHHTLGLEAMSALLKQRGLDCRLLGANVPAESLSAAVQRIRPAGVVLASHLSLGRRSAVNALHAAVEALDATKLPEAKAFYAGNAFMASRTRQGVPGTYLGDNFSQAADLITTITDQTLPRIRPPQQ